MKPTSLDEFKRKKEEQEEAEFNRFCDELDKWDEDRETSHFKKAKDILKGGKQ